LGHFSLGLYLIKAIPAVAGFHVVGVLSNLGKFPQTKEPKAKRGAVDKLMLKSIQPERQVGSEVTRST
jgi:hypothetical protein